MRSLHMLDEAEGAAAEDGALGISRVFLQQPRGIDAVPGAGEGRQHRRIDFAKAEDDGPRAGRLDAFDVLEAGLADGDNARRRVPQAVIGRLHVLRSERRASWNVTPGRRAKAKVFPSSDTVQLSAR